MKYSKELIEKAEKAIADSGLQRFVLLVPPDEDGQMSATMHQVRAKEVINLYINFLIQALDHELAGHPDYKKEYAKIFLQFKERFKKLVAGVNAKIKIFEEKQANESEQKEDETK